MAAAESSTKRRNFTDVEYILLLKQALAVKPYKQKHGAIMDKWEDIAIALLACPDFNKAKLSAKTAQNIFNCLLANVQKKNSTAMWLSGVDEHHSEKAVRQHVAAEKAASNELASETVRQIVVECLKHRSEDATTTGPAKPPKFTFIAELLAEHKEKELAFCREQWETERKVRLKAEQIRQDDNKKFLQLLELLAKKQN